MKNTILKEKMAANSQYYDEGIKRLYVLNAYVNNRNGKCSASIKKEIYNLNLLLSYLKPNDTYDYASKGFVKVNGLVMASWQLTSLYPTPEKFFNNLENLKEVNSKVINKPEDVELPKFDFEYLTEEINNINDYKDLLYYEGFLLQDLAFKVLSEDLPKVDELMALISTRKQELYTSLARTKKL